MLPLLDTSDPLDECRAELGVDEVGQLITPLTRRSNAGVRYAIDNGAFAGFDPAGFRSLLEREKPNRDRCIFVACPDVVGSARRTQEVFDEWCGTLAAKGWPIALVAQDGIDDLPIPWHHLRAIFIGGSTRWKSSDAAQQVALAARALEKWVHVGRVNDALRFDRWEKVADSYDGTGVSRYSHMRASIGRGLPLLAGGANA